MTWLYLDDLREAPEGWTQVRSVNEAIALMESTTVSRASLDHDLGEFSFDGGDGYRLADWMAETETWPEEGVKTHSANPVGAARIQGVVDQYGPYTSTPEWDAAGVPPATPATELDLFPQERLAAIKDVSVALKVAREKKVTLMSANPAPSALAVCEERIKGLELVLGELTDPGEAAPALEAYLLAIDILDLRVAKAANAVHFPGPYYTAGGNPLTEGERIVGVNHSIWWRLRAQLGGPPISYEAPSGRSWSVMTSQGLEQDQLATYPDGGSRVFAWACPTPYPPTFEECLVYNLARASGATKAEAAPSVGEFLAPKQTLPANRNSPSIG